MIILQRNLTIISFNTETQSLKSYLTLNYPFLPYPSFVGFFFLSVSMVVTHFFIDTLNILICLFINTVQKWNSFFLSFRWKKNLWVVSSLIFLSELQGEICRNFRRDGSKASFNHTNYIKGLILEWWSWVNLNWPHPCTSCSSPEVWMEGGLQSAAGCRC